MRKTQCQPQKYSMLRGRSEKLSVGTSQKRDLALSEVSADSTTLGTFNKQGCKSMPLCHLFLLVTQSVVGKGLNVPACVRR